MRRHVLVTTLACVFALSASTAAAAESAPVTSHAAAVQALQAARDVFVTPLSGGAAAGSRDATVALRDLAIALPALRGADRAEARDLLARPTDKRDRRYFGKEADDSPICDAQFCVHWTDKAKNAPVSGSFIDDILDAMAFLADRFGVDQLRYFLLRESKLSDRTAAIAPRRSSIAPTPSWRTASATLRSAPCR